MTTIATLSLSGDAGCHVILASLHENLIELLGSHELVFCQILKDSRTIPNSVDATLVEGSVRTEQDRERLKDTRDRAKTLIAIGSCACFGGIQSLCNLRDRQELMRDVYGAMAAESSLRQGNLPELLSKNLSVCEVVQVDFGIPGCPPEPDEVASSLQAILSGGMPQLSQKNVCDECKRERKGKLEAKTRRLTERPANLERCLLELGYICMGPATRAGCHAKCPAANVPCDGCRGPADQKYDQGVAMLDALTSAGRDAMSVYSLATMSAMYHRYSFATSLLAKLFEKE